jgi:Ca2+ regulator and membrane fusion protein Fig1
VSPGWSIPLRCRLNPDSLGSIAAGTLACILFSTFPGWHEEVDELTGSIVDVKLFPSQNVTRIGIGLSFLSTLLGIGAAFWQHASSATAATMMKLWGLNLISAKVGAVATAFVWISAVLPCAVFWGIITIALSVMVLDILTQSELDREDDGAYWKRIKGNFLRHRRGPGVLPPPPPPRTTQNALPTALQGPIPRATDRIPRPHGAMPPHPPGFAPRPAPRTRSNFPVPPPPPPPEVSHTHAETSSEHPRGPRIWYGSVQQHSRHTGSGSSLSHQQPRVSPSPSSSHYFPGNEATAPSPQRPPANTIQNQPADDVFLESCQQSSTINSLPEHGSIPLV